MVQNPDESGETNKDNDHIDDNTISENQNNRENNNEEDAGTSEISEDIEDEISNQEKNSTKITETKQVSEEEDIEKLEIEAIGKQFKIEERPRGKVQSVFITLLFIFGPVLFTLDLVFSFLFDWTSIDLTYIFGSLTGLFVLLAIMRAKKQASRYS